MLLEIKRQFCERGWFPFNWNLLLHPELTCTMTEEKKNNDNASNYVGARKNN